jgi:hypothetical protein
VRAQSRWVLVAVAFGIVMWATAVYWGSHSEGFQFVAGKLRTSREIQSRVGNVRKVTLPILGQYRERFVNSDKWVKMIVDVEGDKGSVTVRTVLQKTNGVWTVTESSIGAQHVDLN